MHTEIESMSPAQALGRYVDHVCAIRDAYGREVRLAVSDRQDTNGWMIQARVGPPIRIIATETRGDRWRVTAVRHRRSHTVSSTGGSPAALLSAIGLAVDELVAQVLKKTADKGIS
ncbi:hypothetical protein [Mycobacteroides abscessus]|uniref:hypothetical protein n=1 Tax=Mycobacteroides abscessus TaxID=36809 RepID=UPI0009A81696|nr:hypothetical protein [Mycobacteroides abscessus]SKH87777.1 Uncharacterised protein [Mycobacteroides abscessus subsp. massiliense]SKH91899.1 Uncharacterised protein [Mycobacteroides abscessus subsp. massiliense]SKI12539.1 Uncharacterised protein [Mycobacteroides abscessus subsp. massiliense]SKK22146.1 Uncharacterised protein [Mycobacteroides abscessus subsp. massiliense]SKK31135.1 Uncharacterised protein [Mycobacteroides abscessus subsp. massiliense]